MKFLKQSLVAASVIAVVAGLISRIFGYAREAVIANYFGTGSTLDIFLIAFTFPEFINSIIYASLPTTLIPALKKMREKGQTNDTSLFLTGFLLLVLSFVILALLTFLLRGSVFRLLAPGFSDAHYSLGIKLLSIVAFCIFFSGLGTYFRSWQFEKKHFIIPTSSGIVLNIVILITLVAMYPGYGIIALALGWLFSSIALFFYNGISAVRIVGLHNPISINFPWARLLFRSLIFIIILETIPFLYVPIDRYLAATHLEAGYISALKFALVLNQLPVLMFIVAFNVAAFPWISDYSSAENKRLLLDLYNDSIRLIAFIIGFTSVGIILFSNEIVSIAFKRGEFSAYSLILTAEPLRYYSFGSLFYSIYIFQMRFYYARRALLRLGIILLSSLAVKILFSIVLIEPMKHNGLALATVFSWTWGFIVMSIDLNRIFHIRARELMSKNSAKILLNIVLVATLWIILKWFWPYDAGKGFMETLIRFLVLGFAGLSMYAAMAFYMHLPEPLKAYNAIAKRLRKAGDGG